MPKILAIDYGQKRVGLAVTDDLQLIASGLTTIHSKDVIAFLENYLTKNQVECFVVGEPKDLKNNPAESARFIEPFVKHLSRKFPNIKIERVDERFTSKMAFQTMIDAGLGKKARQNKALIDEISATLILQSYLESKNFTK
ncbi:MAG TPA: Holliday junction resolvase RuvX [Vicingus sp.]|nr:Holliday junction resolvase RuvX [Flavobacteriales bacterium]MBV6485077.1 putative pre-16S rRNA nuclease [Flavobacteriales bacterium]HRN43116.1 Holliday junction resolvase RuvX [Vicingus sp.]HRP61306.1 Holliday junction resolvase RuvX [Vicingus sp.]